MTVPSPSTSEAQTGTPLDSLLRAIRAALAVVAPVTCAGCGADDDALCRDCAAALTPTPVIADVPGAGLRLPVVSALRYEGVPRRVLLALKEEGRTDTARRLGPALRESIDAMLLESAGQEPVELVSVPTSRRAYRRRGYDPVALLARAAGFARPARVLSRTRQTRVQKALGREARAGNLVGSLRARYPLDGRRFLLVDDVLTTGATLREAARTLRGAGAHVVGAATLAFTPLRMTADPTTDTAGSGYTDPHRKPGDKPRVGD